MKTEREIIGLCSRKWLSTIYFIKNIDKTMDTIAKNLKSLCDKKVLERKSGTSEKNPGVWMYYYRLRDKKENLSYWTGK